MKKRTFFFLLYLYRQLKMLPVAFEGFYKFSLNFMKHNMTSTPLICYALSFAVYIAQYSNHWWLNYGRAVAIRSGSLCVHKHATARGCGGHAPQGNLWNLEAMRLLLRPFFGLFEVQTKEFHMNEHLLFCPLCCAACMNWFRLSDCSLILQATPFAD